MLPKLTDKVMCQVCKRFTSFSLVEHLQTAHGMSPGKYAATFPSNPEYVSSWLMGVIEKAKRPRAPIAERLPVQMLAEKAADISAFPSASREVAGKKEVAQTLQDMGDGTTWKVPGTSLVLPVNKENTDHDQFRNPWEIPDELGEFAWAYKEKHNTYIIGDSGLGKSFMVRQVLAATKQKHYEVTSNGDATVAMLIGSMSIKGGDTHFIKGALPMAMEAGVPLLWEEMDRTPRRLTSLVHTVISEGKLWIDELSEMVRVKEGFFIIGTGNTKGRGDTTGMYTSAEVMDTAFLNRFVTKIEMAFLSDTKLVSLLRQLFPQQELGVTLRVVKVTNALREACKRGEVYGNFGIRDLVAFMRHLQFFPPQKAMRLAFSNMLDETEATAVDLLVTNHMGKKNP